MIIKLNTVYMDVFTKMYIHCVVAWSLRPHLLQLFLFSAILTAFYRVSVSINNYYAYLYKCYDVDAYCMKCHQMWIEGVTWIQCSVWTHELCLPNDYNIYSAKSNVFTVQYVLLEQI